MAQRRSTGGPRLHLSLGGPPGSGSEDDHHGDNGEHDHNFLIESMSPAQGWTARYQRGEGVVIGWAIVAVTCSHGHVADRFVDGIVVMPGVARGPQPVPFFTGDADDEFGDFVGFFPVGG